MIHQFKNNGYSIVLDVNSGSVHVADPVMYDVISVLTKWVEDMDRPRPLSDKERGQVEDVLS